MESGRAEVRIPIEGRTAANRVEKSHLSSKPNRAEVRFLSESCGTEECIRLEGGETEICVFAEACTTEVRIRTKSGISEISSTSEVKVKESKLIWEPYPAKVEILVLKFSLEAFFEFRMKEGRLHASVDDVPGQHRIPRAVAEDVEVAVDTGLGDSVRPGLNQTLRDHW